MIRIGIPAETKKKNYQISVMSGHDLVGDQRLLVGLEGIDREADG